jgi:hypothetical protein
MEHFPRKSNRFSFYESQRCCIGAKREFVWNRPETVLNGASQ